MQASPLPSKGSYFKASGPKDPILQGFWAILMLRVRVLNLGGSLGKLGFRIRVGSGLGFWV